MKLSRKTKEIIIGTVSVLPIYGTAKFLFEGLKNYHYYHWGYKNDIANVVQNFSESLPMSASEYENFRLSADSESMKIFDNALAQAKLNNEVSQEFLSKHEYKNVDEFWDSMDALYSQGLAGDVSAKELFNSTMAEYQDDFFRQASDMASQIFTEQISSVPFGSFDISLLDSFLMQDGMDIARGILSVGSVAVCLLATKFYIIDETKQTAVKDNKKHSKVMIRKVKDKENDNETLSIEEAREKFKDEKILL